MEAWGIGGEGLGKVNIEENKARRKGGNATYEIMIPPFIATFAPP
jgi:hypothetical protein